MSQENVELVLESFRLDPKDVEARAALFHPEITATAVPGWPEPGPFVGRDAALAETKRLTDWGEIRFTDIDVVADEGDWVVVAYRWHVRGAGSVIATHFDVVTAIRVKEGRFIEWHNRWTRDEALKAAGLGGSRRRRRTLRPGEGAVVGWVPQSLEGRNPMKRILLVVFVMLALALGLSAPASAATADTHASCAGLAGASRAGQPGAQAEVVLRVVTEAHLGGFSPGAVEFSGFAHFHDQSVEVCLD